MLAAPDSPVAPCRLKPKIHPCYIQGFIPAAAGGRQPRGNPPSPPMATGSGTTAHQESVCGLLLDLARGGCRCLILCDRCVSSAVLVGAIQHSPSH